MKYRKKPVVIEAVQWTGSNYGEIVGFAGNAWWLHHTSTPFISTLEGEMRVNEGDFIIKDVAGEFYPCKPDIFEKTYEPVEEV
jgi:hypothetical protein